MPLRPQVQEEMNRMEAMGVIEKITEPTPWVAGMVVVPKKSDSIHICVDLKPLNESVWREIHPIPKVDETLAQLTGARVFSKLDAKQLLADSIRGEVKATNPFCDPLWEILF